MENLVDQLTKESPKPKLLGAVDLLDYFSEQVSNDAEFLLANAADSIHYHILSDLKEHTDKLIEKNDLQGADTVNHCYTIFLTAIYNWKQELLEEAIARSEARTKALQEKLS